MSGITADSLIIKYNAVSIGLGINKSNFESNKAELSNKLKEAFPGLDQGVIDSVMNVDTSKDGTIDQSEKDKAITGLTNLIKPKEAQVAGVAVKPPQVSASSGAGQATSSSSVGLFLANSEAYKGVDKSLIAKHVAALVLMGVDLSVINKLTSEQIKCLKVDLEELSPALNGSGLLWVDGGRIKNHLENILTMISALSDSDHKMTLDCSKFPINIFNFINTEAMFKKELSGEDCLNNLDSTINSLKKTIAVNFSINKDLDCDLENKYQEYFANGLTELQGRGVSADFYPIDAGSIPWDNSRNREWSNLFSKMPEALQKQVRSPKTGEMDVRETVNNLMLFLKMTGVIKEDMYKRFRTDGFTATIQGIFGNNPHKDLVEFLEGAADAFRAYMPEGVSLKNLDAASRTLLKTALTTSATEFKNLAHTGQATKDISRKSVPQIEKELYPAQVETFNKAAANASSSGLTITTYDAALRKLGAVDAPVSERFLDVSTKNGHRDPQVAEKKAALHQFLVENKLIIDDAKNPDNGKIINNADNRAKIADYISKNNLSEYGIMDKLNAAEFKAYNPNMYKEMLDRGEVYLRSSVMTKTDVGLLEAMRGLAISSQVSTPIKAQ